MLLNALRLVLFSGLALLPQSRAPDPTWFIGWGLQDITPTQATPLAGYSSRMGTMALGKMDPIMARALFIQDSRGRRVGLVSCDLIGISAELKATVLSRIPAKLGLGPDSLLICATHSHSGPGAICSSVLAKGACGDFDESVFLQMAEGIAQALRSAHASMLPAELDLAGGNAEGLVRNRRRPQGAVENDLGILRVRRHRGADILIVQAAIHPTLLNPSDLRYSADFPGALVRALEKRGYAVLFLNGALGDQAAAGLRGGDESSRLENFGESLAQRVLEGLARGTRKLPPHLEIRSNQVSLPPSQFGPWVPAQAQVQALELGDHLLFTFPGEPVAEVGRSLRARARRLGYASTWVVGLANDHLGYFDSLSGFLANTYESILTLHGPGSGTAIISALGPPSGEAGRKTRTPPAPKTPPAATRERRGGALFLRLSGSPGDMGFQHGSLLRDEIRAFYAAFEEWLDRETRRALIRRWAWLGPVLGPMRPSALTVPWLCLKARELLPFISPDLVEEMAALARGAGLPFDSVLLMNVFLTMAEQPELEAWFSNPPSATCTNLICLPPRVEGGPLQARNLDWSMGEFLPRFSTVILHEPDTGFPFVSVGWAGLIGSLTAMNNQGLSITEESVASPQDSRYKGEPLMMLIRRVIQSASSLDQALGMIREAPGTCGYHLSVASAQSREARVVELSAGRSAVRKPEGGLLPGSSLSRDPSRFEDGRLPPAELPRSDPAGDRRYAGMEAWLGKRSGPLGPQDLMGLLREKNGGISNPRTLHSVVLDPRNFQAWIAQGPPPASEGPFVHYEFAREQRRHGLPGTVRSRLERAFGPHPAWDEARRPVKARIEELEASSADRPYRLRLLRMASTVESPRPENNTLYARLYEPEGPVLATLLFFPMWQGRESDAEDLISRALARKGFRVALMPQAYQWRRAPRGVRSGSLLLSPDAELTRMALVQSLADAERLAAWLSATADPPGTKLGILGLSLGGFAASSLYSLDPQFGAGVLILAGGEVGSALGSPAPDLKDFREDLKRRGMRREDLASTFAFLDPAPLASPDRCAGLLLVNALFDGVVTYSNAMKLGAAYGGARQVWLPAGHHSAFLFLDEVVDLAADHFQRRLCL